MERKITFFSLKEIVEEQMNTQLYDGYTICRLHKDTMSDLRMQEPMRTDSFGMTLILAGSLRMRIGFSEHEMGERMAFLHSPTTILEFIAMDEQLEMISCMFSLDFLKSIGIFFQGKSSLDFLFDNYLKVFDLQEQAVKRYAIHMEHLQELNLRKSPIKNQMEIIHSTFSLLHYEIESILMQEIVHNVALSGRKEKLCMEFITLVMDGFKIHRSVQHYADALFISRKYLSRVVKEVTGLNPLLIIEQTLMAEIISKLRSNLFSISDIMQQLNFNDLPTFSKFFKKNIGISPNMYRKELLK